MDIEKFISENEVEYSNNPIDRKMLASAEQKTDMKFGKELIKYLTKYGYLAYEYVELYGMNAQQGLESDLIKQTCYLHKYFADTANLVVIENQGEGDYYLVDERDEVFEYDIRVKDLVPMYLSLFEYILQRFESVKGL